MTTEKLANMFRFYAAWISSEYGGNVAFPQQDPAGVKLAHLWWMCNMALTFIEAGNTDKAMRWLGYVQGVLVYSGRFTLKQVKNHSRPEA